MRVAAPRLPSAPPRYDPQNEAQTRAAIERALQLQAVTQVTLDDVVLTADANTVLAGPTSGAAASATFRALVSGDLPSHTHAWADVSKAGSSLADLATRSASDLSSGTLPDGRFPATLPVASGVNLTALNASNLASGTVPDARFPATLPALSGVNLTALNASNLASGTVPLGRLSGITNTEIAAAAAIAWTKLSKTGSSLADLTTRSAADLSSGTLPDGRFPATLPAASGVNLTALNATNLASGNLAYARLPTGSGTWDVGAGSRVRLEQIATMGGAARTEWGSDATNGTKVRGLLFPGGGLYTVNTEAQVFGAAGVAYTGAGYVFDSLGAAAGGVNWVMASGRFDVNTFGTGVAGAVATGTRRIRVDTSGVDAFALLVGSTLVITSARVLQNVTASTALLTSGTLGVARGGTGLTTGAFAQGGIPYASAADVLASLPVGSAGKLLRSTGTLPAWSTVTMPDTFAAGSLPWASASNTLAALAHPGATGYVLATSGAATMAWTNNLTIAQINVGALAVSGEVSFAEITVDGLALFIGAAAFSSDVGFYGTVPITKRTITGSRGGNAALASLLTALAAYGLVTDSTTV